MINKLELLPQVFPHDLKTLQKISNTIEEIEATKNNGILPGLAAWDISLFLNPLSSSINTTLSQFHLHVLHGE